MAEHDPNLEQPKPEKSLAFYNLFDLHDPHTRGVVLKKIAQEGVFPLFVGLVGTGFNFLLDYQLSGSSYPPIPENYQGELKEASDITVDGKPTKIVGVEHLEENFKLHEAKFRELVRGSSLVGIEYFGKIIREWGIPNGHLEIPGGQRMDPNSASVKTAGFFADVARLCAEEGKDILVSNPETGADQAIDIYAILGLGTVLAGTDFSHIINKIRHKPFIRRNLLRNLGYGTSGLMLASWLALTKRFRNKLEQVGVLRNDLPEEEKADILGWSLVDYRDVYVAKGINLALHRYGGEIIPGHPFTLIQGARHMELSEYLRNPSLRKVKEKVYEHYALVGNPSFKRWHYEKDKNEWEVVEEVPYK